MQHTKEAIAGPHINIRADVIFNFLGVSITNSLLLSAFVFLFFGVLLVLFNRELTKKNKSGFYYFMLFVIRSVYDLFHSILGDSIRYLFPLVGGFFFYILLQNWFGLLPGVGSVLYQGVPLLRGNNADLNATLSLAIISVVTIQYLGIKHQGFKGYITKFINFSSPVAFFTGILEIISEFSRIVSFSFRLFGNIFAGEVLLAVVGFLIPAFASFPFLVLEVFTGLIQAVVFSVLSAVLFKLAMDTSHH